MKILSFRVKNHKSLRDETALELLDPSFKTLTPSSGKTWDDSIHTVAGIFGANASGKSNLLDALRYFIAAVRHSSTLWQNGKKIPYAPFRLDQKSKNSDSVYELDFLIDDVRYRYGFGTSAQGIMFEYLDHIPNKRWKKIFTRERLDSGEYKVSFASGIQKIEVSSRELILSRAGTLNRNDSIQEIFKNISNGIDFISLPKNQNSRINRIIAALDEKSISFNEIESLLQIADIGIQKVDLWRHESEYDPNNPNSSDPNIPPKIIFDLMRSLSSTQDSNQGEETNSTEKPSLQKLIQRRLEFIHHSSDANPSPLYLNDESDGTLAWLVVSFAALKAIRSGGIVCGDELDSSLHPYLVYLLIRLFTDESINTQGAQLIFTTHDATILNQQEQLGLTYNNIWFTEKSREGVTDLFSLGDFPHKDNKNIERLYLSGVYGAVPFTAASLFEPLVNFSPSDYITKGDIDER